MTPHRPLRPLAKLAARRLAVSICAALLASTMLMPQAGQAQTADIAAVVNDQVISGTDVQARISLVLSSSNIPDTPDIRAKLEPQVVHQLVDQTLELQEAQKQGITVSQSEVDQALKGLEKQNNMPPGGLDKFLAQRGIPKSTLADQAKAEIAWAKLVRARYGPELAVGENDVADAKRQILAQENQPQNRVAEIFLPVDSPSQDQPIHEAAQRLVYEIQHGASFPQVARQFSQSPSAAVGGDLGWVAPGMLPADVQKVVDEMQPGTLAGPVHLTGGYYILLLIDRRAAGGNTESLDLTQVVLPVPDDASPAVLQAAAQKVQQATANARSCSDMNTIGKNLSPQLSGPLGTVPVNSLPVNLRSTLSSAKVAVPLPPVRVRGGMGVYMVCGKKGGATSISDAEVQQNLERQRFENISERYLSDLRRVAFIDQRA
ncbi:MAG TPA: peptidylprolyl isomerase [Stellaceae bacterium]|nr:peptidylprolyl isomerase [Stellaceae bacterium]